MKEWLRWRLPRLLCCFNNVHVRTYKVRHGFVRPTFESAIADELRTTAEEGMVVVIIGGGHGVCSTIAARQGATVIVYEATPYWTAVISDTIRRNNVDGNVTVHQHAIETVYDAWGTYTDVMPASELPSCDWLVVDAEGAEQAILETMDIRPQRLSVEIHPAHCDVRHVKRQISGMGYQINSVDGSTAVVVHATHED